ncbi:MAG: MerR family transcriptional regulator [Actinobacteria bacterium]|nr:MerR family transcriptional regulator [Actinomycetota bacterium]
MHSLTIAEAAETTGWSSRMLRYIERTGLIRPKRSESGYRLFGPQELQRLRTLRELLVRFSVALNEMGFALRLRNEPDLKDAVDAWFAAEPIKPQEVPASEWLRWEQDKHQKFLAHAGNR